MISPTSPRKRAETARRPHPGFAAHLAHGAFSLPASGPSVGNPKERTQSASRGIQHPGRDHPGMAGEIISERWAFRIGAAAVSSNNVSREALIGYFSELRARTTAKAGWPWPVLNGSTRTAEAPGCGYGSGTRRRARPRRQTSLATTGPSKPRILHPWPQARFAATQPYAGIQFAQI